MEEKDINKMSKGSKENYVYGTKGGKTHFHDIGEYKILYRDELITIKEFVAKHERLEGKVIKLAKIVKDIKKKVGM